MGPNETRLLWGRMRMYCGNETEAWRIDTVMTKEPETIAWIRSFTPGCLFIDIGANIGVYTLFAAEEVQEIRIIAVEPYHPNYHRLFHNVLLNKLENVAVVFAAVSNQSGREVFFLSDKSLEIGASGGQIRESVNDFNKPFEIANRSTVHAVTLDEIGENANPASDVFIKIDVDGQEWLVLDGGRDFLKNPRVKSVLIEVNHLRGKTPDIHELMKESGFSLRSDLNHLIGHSRERRSKDCENVIYTRE